MIRCPKCGSLDVKFTGRLRMVRQVTETSAMRVNVIVVACDCYVCRACREEWADFGRRKDKVVA